jgi:hypothetical protein
VPHPPSPLRSVWCLANARLAGSLAWMMRNVLRAGTLTEGGGYTDVQVEELMESGTKEGAEGVKRQCWYSISFAFLFFCFLRLLAVSVLGFKKTEN